MATQYQYLIVGGGMAGDAAVRGIRAVDPDGTVGVIAAEPDPPYNRPPLSKGLWGPRGKLRRIWRQTETLDATLHLERTVTAIRPERRWVLDHKGDEYTYGKLLIATGCTPRKLSFPAPGIRHLHTVADYHQLRATAELGRRFAVVGGGFVGTEVAAALTGVGVEVTMLFPETGIGARLFPEDLSQAMNSMLEQQGVAVRPRTELDGVERVGDQLALSYRDRRERSDRTLFVDGIVAGIGVRPQIALARDAGLEVGDGIIVDETFRTGDPDIFAAGDVAAYPCPVLGRRRVEHEDHANASGLAAGKAMAGEPEPYDHIPFLYSDFFDLSYEAVGDLDPSLDMISDWWAPYREGVVYYLRDGRIRGILLWGIRGQLDPARRLLRDPGPFTREDLIGRLPESP